MRTIRVHLFFFLKLLAHSKELSIPLRNRIVKYQYKDRSHINIDCRNVLIFRDIQTVLIILNTNVLYVSGQTNGPCLWVSVCSCPEI